jgi:hypothetical protein
MTGMALPQHPARVRVRFADQSEQWLGDPPEADWGSEHRWRFVDDVVDAGWPG